MPPILKKIKIDYLLIPVCLAAVFLLLKSAVTAGLRYQYDIDELFHVQLIYLYTKGYLPYRDVFTFHSPIFHYLFLPVMRLSGFNFNAIYEIRIIMVIFFIVRIILLLFIIKKIFNLRTALLFLPVFLLDPLSNFSAMQIRPDQLMLLLFTAGLLIFILNLDRNSRGLHFLSAVLFSVSVLVSLKSAPSLLVISVFFVLKERKKVKNILIFLFGLALPVILFFLLFLFLGIHKQMLTQIFVDSRLMNTSLLFPGKISFYFKPDNIYLYGVPGKPVLWYYLLSLPFISLIGLLIFLKRFFKHLRTSIYRPGIILAGILSVQLATAILQYSFYIQYFLTISYLVSVFAAYCLDTVFFRQKSPYFQNFAKIILTLLLIFLVQSAITGNNLRANIGNQETILSFTRYWQLVPENEYVFPNFLFRPLAYPLTYGAFFGDIPLTIIRKLPRISDSLEKNRVKYLILNDYTLKFLPADAQKYIRDNYRLSSPQDSLWVRG